MVERLLLTERTLLVSEIFGPTIQGEGPSIGKPVKFLRLGACNLACTFCDTSYTWDFTSLNGKSYSKESLETLTLAEILTRLTDIFASRLVISGGEPMLQQESLYFLLRAIRSYEGWPVEIETNGTIPPSLLFSDLVTQFNVSPKLANSGNVERHRTPIIIPVLRQFSQTGKAIFKFVVSEVDQLEEVQSLVDKAEIDPQSVYVMPMGTRAEEILCRSQVLVNETVLRGWNFTTRLHVLLWGDERGR